MRALALAMAVSIAALSVPKESKGIIAGGALMYKGKSKALKGLGLGLAVGGIAVVCTTIFLGPGILGIFLTEEQKGKLDKDLEKFSAAERNEIYSLIESKAALKPGENVVLNRSEVNEILSPSGYSTADTEFVLAMVNAP